MLEIDGEFFEDPCEIGKVEKILAMLDVSIKAAIASIKSYYAGEPEEAQEMIINMGKFQAGMINAQPLWPPKFATGGIVSSNLLKGDYIIGVDPGRLGCYWS